MKKVGFLLTALVLSLAIIAGSSYVANGATTTIDPKQNLSGVWTNPINPSWNVIISQDKNEIVIAVNFYGGANSDIPVVFHGVGTAKAGVVKFTAKYTVCPAGWPATAKFEFVVQDNANRLFGTSTDLQGKKQEFTFIRKIISKAQVLPPPAPITTPSITR